MRGMNRIRTALFGASLGAVMMIGAILLIRGLNTGWGEGLSIVLGALTGGAMMTYGIVLYERTITDAGTGLYNRRFFFRRLHREWKRAGKRGASIAVAVIDVDDFRSYNTQFGHLAGDVVLKAVADTLRSSVRKGDIIGRWGGEEFAVLFPGATAAEAEPAAERLRRAVEQLVLRLDGQERTGVSVSIGITAGWAVQGPAEPLLRQADAAMYEAKQIKNRVVLL